MKDKFYAIKYTDGRYHKNNNDTIVLFKTKKEIKHYMKYNHYFGKIVELDFSKPKQDTKWQKLKEWCKNQIIDLRHIDIKTKDQNLRVNDGVNCFREVLHKMQELEAEDE